MKTQKCFSAVPLVRSCLSTLLIAGITSCAQAGVCQLPQVAADDMTLQRFRNLYLGKQPVVIKGGASAWVQDADWSMESFLRTWSGFNVTIRDREKLSTQGGFAAPLQHGSISDYLAQGKTTRDLLVFENTYMPFSLALRGRLDFSRLATFDVRMKTILSFGGKIGGLALHWHEENWLAQLAGRKFWIVHAPSDRKPVLEKNACSYVKEKPQNEGLKRCITRESDIIYLPDGWWHATCNLESWTLGIGGMLGLDFNAPPELAAVIDDDVVGLKKAIARSSAHATAQGTIFSYLWDPMIVTPYHVAAMTGSIRILDTLESSRAKLPNCLAHTAAYYGHLEALQWLYARGADMQCFGIDKGAHKLFGELPPLFVASKNGHLEVLRWLVEMASVDPLLILKGVGTALTYSARDGQHQVVDYLLAVGGGDDRTYLDVRDESGLTAAQLARQAGHNDMARLLKDIRMHGRILQPDAEL